MAFDSDLQGSKKITVGTVSTETDFEKFESLALIDAGSDGFNLIDEDSNEIVIPTGIPITIGGPGSRLCKKITVSDPDTGTLNVSYILYQ